MQPTILIASTTWWAMPARLALAFSKAGARVSAIVPSGSPICRVRSIRERFRYSSIRPLHALRNAITATRPDLIVPCDDRVVDHLHDLYAQCCSHAEYASICALITKSLGPVTGYAAASSRGQLLELARQLGVRVPDTAIVATLENVEAFIKVHGFPLVLKLDGTWGGTGVRVARTWEEAKQAFNDFSKPLSSMAMLQYLSNHDFFPLFTGRRRTKAQISVQRFIEGHSANIMLACWEGSVLASLCVETVYAADQLGSSTIVRTMQSSEMEAAGRILVENLVLSGFCGLDFVLDAVTATPLLIELNPRATQNGHLEPGGRPSLVSALVDKLNNVEPALLSDFVEETIAFFPHILRCDRSSIPYVRNLVQDIPWEEPALVEELMRKPWNRRHLTSLFYTAAKRLLDMPASLTSRRGN